MDQQSLYRKYDDFFAHFNNQSVEVVDPTNWAQCFDLTVGWCWYLGLPISIFSGLLNAWQIWSPSTAIARKYFDYLENTDTFVPKKGDIAVWKASYNNGPGHTGVCNGTGDTKTFECFEQNDPSGSVSHVRTYSYAHVVGFLRYKITIPPMNDPRPHWFDLLAKTEFGETGWEKLTDAQIEKLVHDMTARKIGNGKWNVICNQTYQAQVDSDKITFDQLWSELHKNCDNEKVKKIIKYAQSL